MRNLLWFHSFRRPRRFDPNKDAVRDILDVLRVGPKPAPVDVGSKTPSNEARLGLLPSVYAYLGRACEAFGANAFAIRVDSPSSGHVSPFDTGGLLEHIYPVRGWKDEDKRAFLSDFSWDCSYILDLLLEYPANGGLATYLDADPPAFQGPHIVWKGRAADIWDASVNTWQAWTWELRAPSMPCTNLVYWTCPPDMFAEIQREAESHLDEVDWYARLSERYVPGGISQIIAQLRLVQEEP